MFKRHTISFKNAFNGLIWALQTQPNFKIHIALSITSLAAGMVLHISQSEFLIIILLITMGMAIETVNTAIEQTTDAVDKTWREDIKIAKDVAAGAMLMFAIGAFIIATIIFVPKILLIVRF